MKLHLPNSLRRALITSLAAVPAIFPTLATGAIGGGLLTLTFYASAPMAQAAGEEGEEGEEVTPITYSGTVYTWVGTTENIHDTPNYRESTQDTEGSWTLATEAPTVGYSTIANNTSNPNTFRFVEESGYVLSASFQFSPLTLGGFIVEEGAKGYSIKNNGTASTRSIEIKSATGAIAHSTIKEDFLISNRTGKSGSTFTLSGQLAWDIAKAKTFTLEGLNGVKLTGELTVSGGGAAAFTNGLTLSSGSSLTIGGSSSVVVSGAFTINVGSLTIADGSNISIYGAASLQGRSSISIYDNSVFIAQSLTVTGTGTEAIFDGGGSANISGAIALQADTDTYVKGGTTLASTSGNLTFGQNATLHIEKEGDVSSMVSINGNMTTHVNTAVTGGGTLAVGGNVTVGSGCSFSLQEGTLLDAGGALSVTGSLEIADSGLKIAGGAVQFASSTLTLTGNAFLEVAGAGTLRENAQLSLADSSHVTFGLKTPFYGGVNITLAKNASIDALGEVAFSNASTGVTISGAGTFNAGFVTDNANAVVQVSGTVMNVAQTFTLGTNSHYTFSNRAVATVGGNMTIQNGAVLEANQSTVTVGGNLVGIAGTATITGNAGTVNIEGDISAVNGYTLSVEGSGLVVNIGGGDDYRRSLENVTHTLAIGSGAVVNDEEVHQTGGSVTVSGNGTYNVAGYVLSADGATAGELTLQGGVTMHITGIPADTSYGGAFVLSNAETGSTGVANSLIIDGSSLISEAAMSTRGNDATLAVRNGGLLQLNNGLANYGDGHVALAVDGSSTLAVSGTDTTGADSISLSLGSGATVKLGTAGKDTSVVANNLEVQPVDGETKGQLNIGAYGGAGVSSELSSSSALELDTLHILGTAAGANGQLALNLNLTATDVQIDAGAQVSLNGTYTLSKAIQNEGTLTLDSGILFNIDALAYTEGDNGSHIYTLVTGGGTLNADLGINNFRYNGQILSIATLMDASEGHYTSVKIADGKIIFSSGLQYWKGEGTWDATSTAWNADDSASVATDGYTDGSAVEFGNGGAKAVTIAGGGVSAPAVYITGEDYSFEGGTLTTAAMKVDKSVSFANAVTGLDGSLEVNTAEDATATFAKLIGEAGQALRVTGSGTMHLLASEGSLGSMAVGPDATFKLGSEGSEGSLTVGHATLASKGGTVSNLSITGNSLSAAMQENDGKATLENIHLTAGTADAFVTVSDLVFTGTDNTLAGYITIGDIDNTGIWVAADSTLAMGKVVFDLGSVPLESGHTIIGLLGSESSQGSIAGWNWDNVSFLYNGAEILSGLLTLPGDGKVAINLDQDTEYTAPLYWTGTAGSGWNAASLNWNDHEAAAGELSFKAFADVQFGAVAKGGTKDVLLEAVLPVHDMVVGEGGYTFRGNAIKSYGDLTIATESGMTTFISAIDAQQDMLVQSGSGAGTEAAKSGDLQVLGYVHVARDLDVSAVGHTRFYAGVEVGNEVRLGNHDEDALNGITTAITFDDTLKANALTVQRGTADAPEAVKGTYTFQDIDVTGGTVTFNVDDMRVGGNNDATARVLVNGTLTAGTVNILGNAAKTFNGAIYADLVHISAGGDDHNLVTFGATAGRIERLELVDGAKLSLANPGQKITKISMGDALLRFELRGGRYSGYTIYSTHDNALLELAGITYTTITKLSGREGTEGDYHSFTIDSKGRELTINQLENLKDLTIRSGTAEITASLASAGSIHQDFIIQDAASVNLKASNVMAADSRQIRIENSFLQLNTTEQTLYAAAGGAGNSLYLERANLLGDNATTTKGLHVVQAEAVTEGSLKVEYHQANTISANMTLEAGTTTQLAGSAGASLTLSGLISGEGNMSVEGAGSSVTISGARNTLTGTVTVAQGAELVLAQQTALQNAHLVMQGGSTLTLDTKGDYPITLGSLTLGNNATINIDRLSGTATVDASEAAFELGSYSVADGGALTLNFTFGEGVKMDTVKTYNLFSSSTPMGTDAGTLNELNIWYADGTGGLAKLEKDHYVYGYRQDGDEYVFYIRTRFGNIWQGGEVTDGSNSGTWSLETEGFWKDGSYQEEGVAYKDALFVDLDGVTESRVSLAGEVAPGNVYFDADKTAYYLTASGGGKLAADTVIHTSGAGDVHLALENNATTASAISGMNVHAGTVYLDSDLAFSGTIVVDPSKSKDETIALNTQGHQLVAGNYEASGIFKGVTLGQEDTGSEIKGFITGAKDAPGSITNAVISVGTTEGGYMELSYATLEGNGSLNNVTIGSGVSVGAKGEYTLTGTTRFNDALKVGDGATVTFVADAKVDIGGLTAEINYGEAQTVYIYTILTDAAGGNVSSDSLSINPTLGMMLINGVNLGNLNETTAFISQVKDENGNGIAGKIQITLTGADITQWDERWGVSGGGPAVGITNTEDGILYDGTLSEADTSKNKYLYSNLVEGEGNDNLVVASISREWESGEGSLIGSTGTDKEIWIYNHGTGHFTELVAGSAKEGSTQSGATHLMVTGGQTEADTLTVAGSKNATQTGDSYLTIKGDETTRGIVVGGTYGADQSGASHVFVDGGTIQTVLVAGSYEGNMTGDINLTITGGSFATVYGGSYSTEAAADQGGKGNAESNITVSLTGGTIDTFYGGGTGITGGRDKTLSVTVDGAAVDTLYATNAGGSVAGSLELNLLSGTAEVVKLADSGTTVYGNYVVRLGSAFELGNVTGAERTVRGIYGGRESGSGITMGSTYTSRLELVDAGAFYDFFQGDYNGTEGMTEIAGFDEIALADDVTLRVDNRYFCTLNNVVISTLTEGATATVLFGKSNEGESGGSGATQHQDPRTGSITLEKGIRLKLETSYAYNSPKNSYSNMPSLYVGDGATLDLTGYPREQTVDDGTGSISFQIHLAGDGVDGKGAMYKGASEYSSSPDGKAAIPYLVLDDNASIMAEGSSIVVDGWEYKDTYLQLNQNTLTKIGNQTLRFYASQEGDRTNTGLTGGTIYVKEGTVDYLKASQAREVDYVLGEEGTLSLSQHNDGTSLVIRSLSGDGTVDLTKNTKLTIESDYRTSQGVFYSDWLGEGKYNNANSGGFAYGVFSGTIVSDDASVELIKTGAGTQVLSGGDSTYQGLTKIQEGTLYLIEGSTGKLTSPQQSASIEKGSLGQSALVWESISDITPILKLGDGVRIFNDGYAMNGTEMTFEVAAAPQGTSAMDYVVRDADGNPVTITVGDQTYYQMDTTSLKSVNATGFYADADAEGSKDYNGGTIDRNRTLYLSATELDKTVGDSLNGSDTAQTITQQLTGCEKIDVGQLESAGLSSLDCKGYYGNGTAYVAGAEIDNTLAETYGLYVAPADMTATAGLYLAYQQDPAIATIEGTDYVQYNLGRLTDPADVAEGLRDAPYFAVTVEEKSGYGTIEKVVYMTYAELEELAKAEENADESLISINRVCYEESTDIPDAAKELSMVMGEAYVITEDIGAKIACLTVKDDATSVAADGYYVDGEGNIIGTYTAGDTINSSLGTLLIPADKESQSLVVVTGLNASGYEEATYSGVLSDGGADSPSHFTKIGQGTLTIDQRSLYSGNTNLKEGTLNLKGWAQLQREVEGTSSRFIQEEGTSLKLSYDGTYTDADGQVNETRELASDLEIVGSGDKRWENEATTEYKTAALISDVGEDVSFTLSGTISGHGNVLHSGAGQLHISGENTYDGGTTITEGVVYVESSTALGDTAGTNMAAKVAVSKHTEDEEGNVKGGTLVITNGLGEVDSNGRVGKGYVQFNSNRNEIEGTVIIGGYKAGADTDVLTGDGANADGGSTLLMTGNGYWAEKTVISDKSALVFNGVASSNKVMEGEEIIHEAGLLTGSGTLAVSGPMGSGTTVRFASIEADDASFQGSIYVEGNNAKLEIGSGNYAVGEGQVLSISGYDATVEAEYTSITISDGGRVDMSSYGHEGARGADLDRDAARLVAAGVTVDAGGTFATRNAATSYRYNLAAIERQTQVSTQETLIGNRSGAAPDYEKDSSPWVNVQKTETALALPTDLNVSYNIDVAAGEEFAYTRSYTQSLALNQNRTSVVESDLTFKEGSTYEASFANTSLGGHALTLQAGAKGDAYSVDNRITLKLSLNGNAMQWDEKGRGTSQVVLFTDVSSVTFTYNGQTVNTDTMDGDIFYMAAKDFFYDYYDGRYIDSGTLLVYDKGAQIVYLDAALPEPTTTTLSLLALTALLSRRRRKK